MLQPETFMSPIWQSARTLVPVRNALTGREGGSNFRAKRDSVS